MNDLLFDDNLSCFLNSLDDLFVMVNLVNDLNDLLSENMNLVNQMVDKFLFFLNKFSLNLNMFWLQWVINMFISAWDDRSRSGDLLDDLSHVYDLFNNLLNNLLQDVNFLNDDWFSVFWSLW